MREPLDPQYVKAALITPANPWQTVDVYPSIDSTNLEALRDPLPWRVVVADYQGAGRGRLARQWVAPAGTSIAVSAVVPMPVARNADWGWLPLLTGMAMRAALADLAYLACGLKWPNDVLVQEQDDEQEERSEAGGPADHPGQPGQTSPSRPWLKVSGVLCEMAPGDGLVVLGAGANIAQERSELPVETATSLVLCGAGNIRREDVIVRYLAELADLHQTWSRGGAGLQSLRTAYRSQCLTIGLDVDVHQPNGQVAGGTATGVDDSGRLVVDAGGSSAAHAAGDVVHVRRSRPAAGRKA